MIALALVVLATHVSVVDETWSCPVFPEGATHQVGFVGSVDVGRGATMQFWPTPLAYDEPAVLPGVEVKTRPGSITWDPRKKCARSHVKLSLAPHGLRKESVVTTKWLGTTTAHCASETQILFRARIIVERGEPAHARVIAVDLRSRKPLGYLDWTPTRIASWFGPTCEAQP